MLKRKCARCGGKSSFTLLFADPTKKGGKERSAAPVPLVWECEACRFAMPVVLVKHGAC